MTKFMLLLAAASICGPIAANAAVMPTPKAVSAVMISAAGSADAPYQVAHLNGQVAVLTSEVQGLQIQYAPGTAYVAELSGVIPTGG